jgi:hypothetical protein
MKNIRTAIAAAAILTVALAGTVSAATSTTNMPVTVTIDKTISISGAPSSLDFGHRVPGQGGLSTDTVELTTVSSEASFTVTAAATNFVSGGNQIPSTALVYKVTPEVIAGAAGVPVQIGTTNVISFKIELNVPVNAKSGTYAATITFAASN